MDFAGRNVTLKNIDPALQTQIIGRMKEIAGQLHLSSEYSPIIAQQALNGAVHIAFAPPKNFIGFGSTDGAAMSVLGAIAGAGLSTHGKSMDKPPRIESASIQFASMQDLILSLNALAKDQSQKIDVPETVLGR